MKLLLKDILNMAESRFIQEKCLTPRLDAEILFCHMMDKDKPWLFLHYGDELDDKLCEEYFKLVDIRASGMPLQYIIGNQEFMGLNFQVSKDVLIPRQDTEGLVEKALSLIVEDKAFGRSCRILDLCCGSGAIAVSLAYHLKQKGKRADIVAADISPKAISIAKKNAIANGVERYIRFVTGDLFEPLTKNKRGRRKPQFDLILSNPPYIPTMTLPKLMREVRDHEPLIALDGGADGIDFYIRILGEAYQYLKKDGVIIFEIGHDQGTVLPILVDGAGAYGSTEIIKDLAGKDRLALISANLQKR